MSIERYKKISKGNVDVIDFNPTAYIPKLTESDYKLGYIKRYFIQKSNDDSSSIIEVNSDDFGYYVSNPFFKGKSIRWRIVGNIKEVMESNSASISIGRDVMPNLHLYLQNLLQFHK